MEGLRRMREEAGLTQVGLAKSSGVDRATINKIEQGKRSPTIETLGKLARAMGVEISDFFPKAQTALWSDDEPKRQQTFGYVEARQSLDEYCAVWERRLAEGDLDHRAIEEFMVTGLGLLPVMDIAVQTELDELARSAGHVISDERERHELLAQSEIRKANQRYLAVFSEVTKILKSKIEEKPNETPHAETNVVRLQEVRDRLMDTQKKWAVG